MKRVVEAGKFKVMVDELEETFEVCVQFYAMIENKLCIGQIQTLILESVCGLN